MTSSSVSANCQKSEILTLKCTPNLRISLSWSLLSQIPQPPFLILPRPLCQPGTSLLHCPHQPDPVPSHALHTAARGKFQNTAGPRWNLVASALENCEFLTFCYTVLLTLFHLKSPTGINKLWYMHTVEYYSVIKRNALSSQDKTWRKFKCIFLSERSYLEKAACSMIPTL